MDNVAAQDGTVHAEVEPEQPSKVVLSLGIQPTVNFALWANHVPVLSELSIVNTTGEALKDVTIDIESVPPAIYPKTWRLSGVGEGAMRALTDLDLELDGPWLTALTEAVRGMVTATARAEGRVVAEERRELRFLAHNEWGGASGIPDLLAAFVQPNDPSVARVLHKASDLLRAQGKHDGLEGYQAKSKKRLWEQSAAIWSAVCSFDIRYVNPPQSFEQNGQRIRPPRQIIEQRLATCLDLAVLFASCLEQVGLRPLIVLTQGHAFAGAWLSQNDFGTSVASDGPSLRTRLALDDLLVFETTLCCHSPAPSFTRACEKGAAQLVAERDQELVSIVDVHRARQRQIRPLNVTADGESVHGPEREPDQVGPPLIGDAPPLREGVDGGESEPPTPGNRIAVWRKRLLDLSGRNRLLNLRLEGKQALTIDCPDAVRLESLLSGMRSNSEAPPLRFRPWPDLMSGADPRSAAIYRDRLNDEANRSFAIAALNQRELLIGHGEEPLQTSLTELYRTARAAQQEGGANTLYLTIGFLLWRAKGKDKPYRAPLVLVPVVLNRPSIRSGFTLKVHDDETRINTTLLEMLRQEYGVSFPDLERFASDDGAAFDVRATIDAMRAKLRSISGWEVTEEVSITNLSFTKYLMWKDLADRADGLRGNEVARRLIDGRSVEEELDPPAVRRSSGDKNAGGCLDDEPDLTELACPMEADSSQIQAVAAAARVESFVLIGPPGTGKSQTIANIISNTLAQGRTVLFVAEKRAALEVVQRRLDQVGLSEFCLDLFSAKASKMAVLQQLNRAQQVSEDFTHAEWLDAGQKTTALRVELNSYVRELHWRGRNGWTPFRAIGCLLRAETAGIPEISLNWSAVDAHDEEAYKKLGDTVQDAAVTFERFDASGSNVLSGVNQTDWSPTWQSQLIEASRSTIATIATLQGAIAPALLAFALPPNTPLVRSALEALHVLVTLVLDPAAPEAAWALSDNARDTCEMIRAAESLAYEHADIVRTLSGDWQPSATELPLEELLAEWRQSAKRWLVPRRMRQQAVLKRLASSCTNLPADPSNDLQALITLREKELEFKALSQRIGPVVGARWRDRQSNFERLEIAIALSARVRAATAALTHDAVSLLALRDHVRRLLSEGADLLSEGGGTARDLYRFRDSYVETKLALDALIPLSFGDRGSVVSETSPSWLALLVEKLNGWISNASHLRDWCAWRGMVQRADALGLSPILLAIETGTVAVPDAARVFEANYARWWVNLAVNDLPLVRGFVAAQHEQQIKRFRDLDRMLLTFSVRLVRARLAGNIPDAAERQKSAEYGVLTRELAKRQRHIPLRQLVTRMPRALRQLTPCLMMSPLSVAQYLPAESETFDLVIFDEASQIPTWDAIGAIGRGRQVIVVGDPMQLPPTRFFERQTLDGDGGDQSNVQLDSEDMESVLDECLGSGIPSTELSWHYRSRHESLIAFSNHRYYGGRLVTFPSPVVKDAAVTLQCVADGVYARGGARTNQIEARAVVREVLERLRAITVGGRATTIGIVTFNAEQQSLIENMLDEARRAEPSLERFFSDDAVEPVLVKNLESVQGEERDIIIFSLTYGPDVTGRVAMNFGPLNQAGGERRLNVAVTRAREALLVFSSLRPEQIDLSRTAATGVAHLKQFLTFAHHGARAFATAATGPLGDFESPFEAAVAERLRAKGWIVHPQIGVSGFRVDLGVVHPDAPGLFLAGIECDGATYHRSAMARDRDRLRQAILEGLDWRLLRIWSTDWWTNASRETERVHAALQALLETTRTERINTTGDTGLSGAVEPNIVDLFS